MDVLTAARVFGSEPRLRLLSHYQSGPTTQTAAAEALGVSIALASQHTHVLINAGIVIKVKGGYVVDPKRLGEVGRALARYLDSDWIGPKA